MVAGEPTAKLLTWLDTRSVVITPGEPLETPPPLPPFETRLRATGELAISFRTHEASVEQVLTAAREAGVHIKDLRTEEPDLEDAFLALTYDVNAALRPACPESVLSCAIKGNQHEIHRSRPRLLFAASAGTAEARGFAIKGAVVGGVAGHFAHHHALAGAAIGCVVSHHMAHEHDKRLARDARHDHR